MVTRRAAYRVLTILAVSISLHATFQAHGAQLEFNVSGRITDVVDPNGDFPSLVEGSPFAGVFRYDSNLQTEDFSDFLDELGEIFDDEPDGDLGDLNDPFTDLVEDLLDVFGPQSGLYLQPPPLVSVEFFARGIEFRGSDLATTFIRVGDASRENDGVPVDEFSIIQQAAPEAFTGFDGEVAVFFEGTDAVSGTGLPSFLRLNDWQIAEIVFEGYTNQVHDAFDPFDVFVVGGIDSITPSLQPGDSDRDHDFDQIDLVQVQIANKYRTGLPATWGEGDWDGAPGGSRGVPPRGDGRFDQLDIIAALGSGLYLTGPYGAIGPRGAPGDGQTSVGYDSTTGEIWIDAPDGIELTSINIDSVEGIFSASPAANLGGSFDNHEVNNIFKATFGSSFGSTSFGNVAQAGLSEDFLLNDLTAVGSLAGGGALGEVDLIYVPEPPAAVLLWIGLFFTAWQSVILSTAGARLGSSPGICQRP